MNSYNHILKEILEPFDVAPRFRGSYDFRSARSGGYIYGDYVEKREYADYTIGWYPHSTEGRQRLVSDVKAELEYLASFD